MDWQSHIGRNKKQTTNPEVFLEGKILEKQLSKQKNNFFSREGQVGGANCPQNDYKATRTSTSPGTNITSVEVQAIDKDRTFNENYSNPSLN